MDLTDAHDDIRRVLGLAVEEVLQDLLRACSVPRLRIKRGPRVMRHHAVACTQGVLHRAPWVLFGRRLLVPYVTGVAVQVAVFERGGNVLGIANGAARGIDEPGALPESGLWYVMGRWTWTSPS